ncbi:cell wall protein PhiA [Colletotrichum somersetense]|nr:cell wall protein PhiA [Colletotrichum somersetense]
MQFTNALAVAATLAAAVSGATIPSHIEARDNGTVPSFFKLQVDAINTPINLKHFQAANNSVFVGLPKQGALCSDPTENEATFFVDAQDGRLNLYSGTAVPQVMFADRSGMGQGKFGYTTGVQPPPSNAEQTGWVGNEAGDLTLSGANFIACPNSIDGAWSIWVDAGVTNPAGNTGCVPISARLVAIPKPVGCDYTQITQG